LDRAKWDSLADNFETEACDIAREETHDLLGRFVRAARPLPDEAVLVDLGCGLGSFIKKYQSLFARIVAMEFAPRIIARAKKRCANVSNVTWLTMDIPQAARAVGTVADLTVCMNVITQPGAKKRDAMWAAVAEVTKPGGFALLVVPSLESELMVARVLKHGGEEAPAPMKGGLVRHGDAIQKHFERDEFGGVLGAHGFAPLRIERIYYPWAKEGMRKPRFHPGKGPWDWICLARRSNACRPERIRTAA
jgi:cyclopropane fatty-acyl-phospholipid synthase-like methyltransferase